MGYSLRVVAGNLRKPSKFRNFFPKLAKPVANFEHAVSLIERIREEYDRRCGVGIDILSNLNGGKPRLKFILIDPNGIPVPDFVISVTYRNILNKKLRVAARVA